MHYLLSSLFTDVLMIILAFSWRAGGGAISLGPNRTNEARLLFKVLPTTLILLLVAHTQQAPLWLIIFCAINCFIVSCIGHSSSQGDTLSDYLTMSLITTATISAILWPFSAYFIIEDQYEKAFVFTIVSLFFGLFGGLGDYLGYKCTKTLKFWGITWCVPGDASWGELFRWGISIGCPISMLAMHS